MKKEITIYDKNDVYQEKIEPLIKELKVLCNVNQLPMFTTVAVKSSEEGTEYKSDIIMATIPVKTKDRGLASLLLRLNNFPLDLPEYIKDDVRLTHLQKNQGETLGKKFV